MKKSFFIIINIFQIILLIFAYVLSFLSHKKMGVMRHFVYKNNKLNNEYNMENIINILCFIIFLIIIFALINLIIFIFRKNKNLLYSYNKYFYIINISLMLLGFIFIIFLKYFSIDKILTYYYISLIFLIVYIIEFIKAIIYTIKITL